MIEMTFLTTSLIRSIAKSATKQVAEKKLVTGERTDSTKTTHVKTVGARKGMTKSKSLETAHKSVRARLLTPLGFKGKNASTLARSASSKAANYSTTEALGVFNDAFNKARSK